MNTVRISKEFSLEMAHALHNYDGKCANIHGHSYQLTVTLIGQPKDEEGHPKNGMLMDFGDLKKIVSEEILQNFDHALVLKDSDPLLSTVDEGNKMIVRTEYQPSCENLLLEFVNRISKKIEAPLKLHSVILRETNSSYASWFASDNE